MWHLNTLFVPLLGILATDFATNCGFVIPRKAYFIKFELFFILEGQKFDQTMQKKKKKKTLTCYNHACTLLALLPNNNIYITFTLTDD